MGRRIPRGRQLRPADHELPSQDKCPGRAVATGLADQTDRGLLAGAAMRVTRDLLGGEAIAGQPVGCASDC
eukprot:7567818-Alexandrium_andersonii.AAC.1